MPICLQNQRLVKQLRDANGKLDQMLRAIEKKRPDYPTMLQVMALLSDCATAQAALEKAPEIERRDGEHNQQLESARLAHDNRISEIEAALVREKSQIAISAAEQHKDAGQSNIASLRAAFTNIIEADGSFNLVGSVVTYVVSCLVIGIISRSVGTYTFIFALCVMPVLAAAAMLMDETLARRTGDISGDAAQQAKTAESKARQLGDDERAKYQAATKKIGLSLAQKLDAIEREAANEDAKLLAVVERARTVLTSWEKTRQRSPVGGSAPVTEIVLGSIGAR